ncbi:MAG: C-terminal binding protein [Phycisphaeraceae bacterium]|nr:C-terminal binding protein [Phycisphaeraceae bacterium]
MPATPTIVRLNSRTMPLNDMAREMLATLSPRLVEIEGGDEAEILAAAREADAIMIISAYLHAEVIRDLKHCKIISRIGTGVDKIDIAAATRKGIIVNNLPDVFTEEVADHTLALLLAAARRLKALDHDMRAGRRPASVAGFHRLSAQTVGIIGFGLIGRAVARRCRAFGMTVLANDPCLTPEQAAAEDVTIADLDALLAESDYVCPLCPLLPSTRGMLALPQFRNMKRTAVLVNTGRGELANEDDLAAALREGIIRYAALDVFGCVNIFGEGGFPTRHALFRLENVLLTPHWAAASEESADECQRRAARAVVDVLSGRWPEHAVNPEVTPWFAPRQG